MTPVEIGILSTLVGGAGTITGVLAKTWLDDRKSARAADIERAKIEQKDDLHDREITRDTAFEDREERRRMGDKVEAQFATIRDQAVEIAEIRASLTRCQERHEENDARDAAKDAKIEEQAKEIRELRIESDLSRQFMDRQRVEIDGLVKQLDTLRSQFDSFVKGAMGVDRLSEVPGA